MADRGGNLDYSAIGIDAKVTSISMIACADAPKIICETSESTGIVWAVSLLINYGPEVASLQEFT